MEPSEAWRTLEAHRDAAAGELAESWQRERVQGGYPDERHRRLLSALALALHPRPTVGGLWLATVLAALENSPAEQHAARMREALEALGGGPETRLVGAMVAALRADGEAREAETMTLHFSPDETLLQRTASVVALSAPAVARA